MALPLRAPILLLFIWAMLALPEVGAQQTFTGTPYPIVSLNIEKALKNWEVYQMDLDQIDAYVHSSPGGAQVNLLMGQHDWQMVLVPNEVVSSGYSLQVKTDYGIETFNQTKQLGYKGYETTQNGDVRMTIDDNFLYGFVKTASKTFFVEPLWYYEPTAPHNLVIVYDREDVKRDNDATCAVIETEGMQQKLMEDAAGHENDAEKVMACYQLELAIASDRSMFDKYGSVSGVQAHNIGVINNVQNDYTGNFTHDIQFQIVTQFVVTGTDPWTASLDAGTLLSSFASWGNNGNFGVPFDLGELWTNRDFTGGTVGIAYLSSVCTSNKYHCLQDFTTNAELLRCMTSHEIGHNFSCTHDPTSGSCPPDYIMCPFVSTSSEWSATSVSQVNAFTQTRINNGCLSPCGPPLVADFSWSPIPACAGQPVTFTDETVGNVLSRSWVFQGGTPPNSTLASPTATWSGGGTFNVTLTVTGANGSSSITKQVTIQPLPVASYTYTVNGLIVSFTNTSTNANSYIWDFGDGNSSFDVSPDHEYAEGGVYTVVLTASNECGTSTKTFNINTAPSAYFTADPTSGCATLSVQYQNESTSNATSFNWQFPGGSPAASSLANPVVLYSVSGTYTATLTAYNAAGSTSYTRTNYITVQNVPSANFSYSANNLTVSFTNNSVGGTSYLWNFGDNTTSTATNPTHTYAVGGTYVVTLTTTNPCGTTTATKTVVLAAPPTAAFTASPTNGCASLSVQLTNQTTGGATTYFWNIPGGTPDTSSATSPLVTFANPGTYTVTLTASNGIGSSTATQTITVNGGPTAAFSSNTSGTTTTFTNNSTNATSYSWSFGDGDTSTEANPEHTYAADGSYTVVLTAMNACDTTTSTSTVVIVTPPTANFTATPTSGCAPLTVQYTNASSANAVSYEWTFPGGSPATSSAQNPVVVYAAPGTYSATLVATNTAGSNSFTATNLITVNAGPSAAFTNSVNGAAVTFTNGSTNANSYSWDFGDNSTSADADPVHTYTADGTYTVVLTATNACGASTSSTTVTIVTPPTASFIANNTAGCAPLTVQFNNTSSANATGYSWEFPGGNPATSTEQNPVVVYDAPGTYSVVLTVSNAAGTNSVTQTNIVTVATTPGAAFTSAVNGATASFTNGSTNATAYTWDFGDNTTANAVDPEHTYANDGVYTVILTASNACGTSTSSQTVTIVTPPTAGFTAFYTTGCAPLAVQFNNTSSANAVSFAWEFPGGTPSSSTDPNPVVTYNAPGVYDIVLVVSNSAGSSTAIDSAGVIVTTVPTSGFTSSVTNSTATFTNTSSGATSYAWDFGDNSGSNDANPTHTYGADGTYTVVLTATNYCGSTTFTQEVVIITSPNAGFTANTTTGCPGFTVQFTDLSTNNTTSWNWTFPGGTPATSTDQNPVVTYDTPGVYDVTLEATSAGGTATFTQPSFIHVLDLPTAGFVSNTNGATVSFTNTSVNATSYFWDFGDGSTSVEAEPTHTYSNPGGFTVTLKAINGCGSAEYQFEIVVAGQAPTAAFTSGETNGCIPFTVQYSDQSTGEPTGWLWTFQGGTPATSTAQNPTVTYNTPGTFSVSLQVSNAFGTNSATSTAYITANSLPAANFNFATNQGTVTFNNTSINATTYTWNFGDGTATSNEPSPTHTYAQSGTYTVGLTATNNCGASTLQEEITIVLTGVDSPEWLEYLRVYPNPNAGNFFVEMAGQPGEEVEFTVFNAIGSQVKRQTADFQTGKLIQPMQLGDLPAAMYTLRVRQGGNTAYVKIVIQ